MADAMDSGFGRGVVGERRQLAAQGKGIRLWNLTTATISSFQLSPAGKNTWVPTRTLNARTRRSTTTSACASQA